LLLHAIGHDKGTYIHLRSFTDRNEQALGNKQIGGTSHLHTCTIMLELLFHLLFFSPTHLLVSPRSETTHSTSHQTTVSAIATHSTPSLFNDLQTQQFAS
jgi:hypothetical protein